MYIRRIYYDDNGIVLHTYMEQGDIVIRSMDEDCNLFNIPKDANLIEQIEPDEETEVAILSVGWNEGKMLKVVNGKVIVEEE